MGIGDPGMIRSLGKDKVHFVTHLIADCGVTQGHSRLLIPFPRRMVHFLIVLGPARDPCLFDRDLVGAVLTGICFPIGEVHKRVRVIFYRYLLDLDLAASLNVVGT